MSKMLAEVIRIVNDMSSRITQYDIIHEAITNAIQANATNITCSLYASDATMEENGVLLGTKKIDEITVTDDGDGFNEENYNSFCTYRTILKKELGCKGVGRFTFLKVYSNAHFKSAIAVEKKIKSFTFNLEFDTEKIKKEDVEVKKNETEIKFTSLAPNYYNLDKKLDRRIVLDVEKIRERALAHLIPILFFYRENKGKTITITFKDQTSNDTATITKDDVPKFSDIPFTVEDKSNTSYNFNLFYVLDQVKGSFQGFYCGANRTVCEISEKRLKLTLPFGYKGYFLIASDYLTSHVNNERDDFDIMPQRTDFHTPLSWEMINAKVKKVVQELVKTAVPQVAEINKEKLQTLEEERPYLVNYIEEDDLDMLGFLDKESIIEKAKKRFDDAKEKVLINAGKKEYTNTELNEAIQLTQNELVAYIYDRVLVLERLKKMVTDKEKVEKVIHNLFMQKNSEDDYFCLGKNNLWLLDDRFTTYSYAASDKRIKDVLSGIGESSDGIENANEKPDLSLFFSHDPSNQDRLRSVLVELKPFDPDDKKKFAGVQQLLDYVEAFKSREKIEEVFAFLVTDIDEDLKKRLIRDEYTPLFSTMGAIYHRPYPGNISIYVVGAETLIHDAEARNKVFLDIIKKQSRIHDMLKKDEGKVAATEVTTDKPQEAK